MIGLPGGGGPCLGARDRLRLIGFTVADGRRCCFRGYDCRDGKEVVLDDQEKGMQDKAIEDFNRALELEPDEENNN